MASGWELISGAAGGVVSTVQSRDAGDGSTLFAASMARTRKLCAPSSRPLTTVGALHDENAAESSEHSNVEFDSLDTNPNVAVLFATVPVGPELIAVLGGVESAAGGPPPPGDEGDGDGDAAGDPDGAGEGDSVDVALGEGDGSWLPPNTAAQFGSAPVSQSLLNWIQASF